jgi:6-phosphogluconolactonase
MSTRALWLFCLGLLLVREAKGQNRFVYTNDDSFSGPNTVSAFGVNADGSLSKVSGSPFSTGGVGAGGNGFGSSPRIAISLDGKFLYAANDGTNDVSSFSINPATGVLTLITGSPFPTGGNDAGGVSLAVSTDGRFVYASNANSANITILRVSNGSLQAVGSPIAAPGGTFPVDMKVTADGKYLAVTLVSFSGGLVGMYNIGSDGSLAQVPGSPFADGNPAGGFTDSVDSNCAADRLFVLNNSGLPLVDVFSIGVGGTLSQIPNSPYSTPGGGGGTLYLSPDEKRLLVGNQQNSISVFGVSPDGSLTLVPNSPFPATGGAFLSGVAIDATSRFVYGAGFNNEVVGLAINPDSSVSPIAGSPFSTGRSGGLEALAVYPPKTCSTAIAVEIVIKPGSSPASINAGGQGTIPVAILSHRNFNAPAEVNPQSLTFGHSGNEASLTFCDSTPEDLNGDGLPDLVCHFTTKTAAFQAGDTQGILKGATVDQRALIGAGPVQIVPPSQ